MGKIHSIETFGAVDGPGIRFVIFTQGCPMRCQYCHNPDTWYMDGGEEMSIDDLLSQIEKYKHYFGKEGGVTLTGGEPLAQIDFAIELFERLKEQNINTCLDTSGVLFGVSKELDMKINRLLEVTDLVLLDIKHIDNDKHKIITSHENKNILDFARYLSKIDIPVWIRYVLVPTLTDDLDDVKKLKEFLNTLKNVQKIEVLPYHAMGINKYDNLNIDYKLKDVKAPTKELVGVVNKILIGEE